MQQPFVCLRGVFDRSRKGMLGCEPIIQPVYRCLEGFGHCDEYLTMRLRRSEDIAAPMQVQHDSFRRPAGHAGLGNHVEGESVLRTHRFDHEARWNCQREARRIPAQPCEIERLSTLAFERQAEESVQGHGLPTDHEYHITIARKISDSSASPLKCASGAVGPNVRSSI